MDVEKTSEQKTRELISTCLGKKLRPNTFEAISKLHRELVGKMGQLHAMHAKKEKLREAFAQVAHSQRHLPPKMAVRQTEQSAGASSSAESTLTA